MSSSRPTYSIPINLTASEAGRSRTFSHWGVLSDFSPFWIHGST